MVVGADDADDVFGTAENAVPTTSPPSPAPTAAARQPGAATTPVTAPVAASPVPATTGCNHDPCLPPASDYDCKGGSGNGPVYTGRVRVIGQDIYDLDSDGDGIGCEQS